MPRVGFHPTIPEFERAKTVHALDRTVTVIGTITHNHNYKNSLNLQPNPSSLTAEDSLHSRSSCLISVLYYLYSPEAVHRKHIRWRAIDICEPHRKHLFLYCIYSALHSNGRYPIVAAGVCLPSSCLEMCPHVTILSTNIWKGIPPNISSHRWLIVIKMPTGVTLKGNVNLMLN
jgi:hypothetical protein